MKLSDLPELEAVVNTYDTKHPLYKYFFRWRKGIPKALTIILNDPQRLRAFCEAGRKRLERMSDTH
jgi:hypothetical protein